MKKTGDESHREGEETSVRKGKIREKSNAPVPAKEKKNNRCITRKTTLLVQYGD